jgi:hypothetical protein
MRWTKLKQRIEERLADSVRDRVVFHMTSYRHAHDGEGRAWITIDGKEVANMCYWRANLEGEYRPEPVPTIFGTELPPQDGIMRPSLFAQSLFRYLSMSIDDAFKSNNFLIRAVALLDRRMGRRRLEKVSLQADDQELVQMFFDLRLKAEGLRDEDV